MSLFWQLFCWSILCMDAHPVYISTTEIHYRPERQAVEIQVKFFSDDMQEVLRKVTGDKRLEIATEREREEDVEALRAYLQERLQLNWNGKALKLTYLGKETERSEFFSTHVYLEATGVAAPQEVGLQQALFVDHIPRQQNIVHLFIHQKKGSTQAERFSFHKGKTSSQLRF